MNTSKILLYSYDIRDLDRCSNWFKGKPKEEKSDGVKEYKDELQIGIWQSFFHGKEKIKITTG